MSDFFADMPDVEGTGDGGVGSSSGAGLPDSLLVSQLLHGTYDYRSFMCDPRAMTPPVIEDHAVSLADDSDAPMNEADTGVVRDDPPAPEDAHQQDAQQEPVQDPGQQEPVQDPVQQEPVQQDPVQQQPVQQQEPADDAMPPGTILKSYRDHRAYKIWAHPDTVITVSYNIVK